MDDRQFDALVKRLTQARLSRLDALRGLAASARHLQPRAIVRSSPNTQRPVLQTTTGARR